MKIGQLIKQAKLNDNNTVYLDKIYPVMPLDETIYTCSYYIDDEEQSVFQESYYCNKIVFTDSKNNKVDILLGKGYLTEFSEEWTNKFITDEPWQGGDGIFSFNITDGKDSFSQKEDVKSLLVFGDTFVGQFDKETEERFEPHLMPNNSLAYLKNNQLEFKLNKGDMGNIKAFYEIPTRYDYKGPIARNLICYDTQNELEGYLSSYNPDSIELVFDLYTERKVTEIEFHNYYNKQSPVLAKRGFKDIIVYGSNDSKSWSKITSTSLQMATSYDFKERVMILKSYRYFKITVNPKNGLGNHNDQSYQEGLFGMNKIIFLNEKQQYKDIEISTNTVMQRERENAWIWLQDGVVVKDNLYFLPLVITGDQTQPEGLQFKVLGISLFKTPIVNEEVKTNQSTAKWAPVFAYDKDSSYYYGAALMANTKQADALNADGYIYIYGYKTTIGLREMIVARVKENNFELFDEWEYFDGEGYSHNILDSKPLLGHVSCEMSVTPLTEGFNKGKYLAVFTYDVNTQYVSIAIGESPVGPFTNPQKVYITKEQEIFKSTTYTYNAKAHPHLSSSKRILVSYNTNTYNFDHNMSNRLIYGPRFIYLNETE
jgi:hypothetical protein